MSIRKYLTPEQLVEYYEGHINTRTLANWRSAGTGGPPFFKLGGRILYPMDRLEQWEMERTARSTREAKND
jgi:hypothetical protein